MAKKLILRVVKIGGNIIDDTRRLDAFLADLAALQGAKILVHGGGKLATRLAEKLGVPQTLIEGRRVTDAETLRIVTMVYGGLVNKQIVAKLYALGCPSIGVCGADGDLLRAHRRQHANIDYGWVGDIDAVNAPLLDRWLGQGLTPVVAPLSHDGAGQLLNTNADTIAQEIAQAMSPAFHVELIYSFEKSGVLLDVNDENSRIASLRPGQYQELKASGVITAGMIPKLDSAFSALKKGVRRVIIGQAEHLAQLVDGTAGTSIVW
ncbi:MAG: acetylglutamate kinase [Thermoanaerobaculia bacterium]|nr:acetylglutamate kinase [Thermoanaerobaculia bacterium]